MGRVQAESSPGSGAHLRARAQHAPRWMVARPPRAPRRPSDTSCAASPHPRWPPRQAHRQTQFLRRHRHCYHLRTHRPQFPTSRLHITHTFTCGFFAVFNPKCRRSVVAWCAVIGVKCKALFMTKQRAWERGALHAAEPYADAAPVDRRGSAVGRVGAAHIGDGSRVSASQCRGGRPLAVASPCEGREPGEHGGQRSLGAANAGAAPGLVWRRNASRSADGERLEPR